MHRFSTPAITNSASTVSSAGSSCVPPIGSACASGGSQGAAVCAAGLTSRPPSAVPSRMAPTVHTSIQPLAATSRSGGSSSVTSPYFAGE